MSWNRNCPKCDKIISYKNEESFYRAKKKNTLCLSCVQVGRKLSEETKKLMSKSKLGKKRTPHTEETKKKIGMKNKGNSPWNKGKVGIYSEEYIKKLSDAKIGTYNFGYRDVSGENNPMFGKKHKSSSLKKMRLSRIKEIQEKCGNIFPNHNPNSISIIEAMAKKLGITDLQHAENGGEFYIKELGYWVDGYSKEKNIVIEYYEPFHSSQKDRDERRKQEIINYLKCEFIEIEEKSYA